MPERTWTVWREVRADASSIFLPVDEAPAAAVGDTVAVDGPAGQPRRRGRVTAIVDDAERGRFLTVDLEAEITGV